MTEPRRCLGWFALLSCVSISACGGTPSSPSGNQATITIGPSGVTPKEVRIRRFNGVMFVNNDTRPHTIASDPVELHSDCPPINYVGFLSPGDSRSTLSFTEARTCGFHDHNNEFNESLQGRIIVED